MQLRLTYSLAAILALAPLGACGSDDDDSSDGGEHTEAGHQDEDGGDEHEHEDGEGSCPHVGLEVECDEEIEAVGATAVADNGATVEVVGVQPMDLTAGEDGDYMVMLMVKNKDGEPVEDGVEVDAVYTKAHGGHMSCGAPELLNMGGGSYHIHGLTYPHGGTWYHDLQVGEDDHGAVSLALCVANP